MLKPELTVLIISKIMTRKGALLRETLFCQTKFCGLDSAYTLSTSSSFMIIIFKTSYCIGLKKDKGKFTVAYRDY